MEKRVRAYVCRARATRQTCTLEKNTFLASYFLMLVSNLFQFCFYVILSLKI